MSSDHATRCRACGAATDAFLCQPCADDIRYALNELPDLLDALGDRAGGMSRTYRASSQSTRPPDADWKGEAAALSSSPLPGDLDATALLLTARNTITTWARHLAETRGLPTPTVRPPRQRIGIARNRAHVWYEQPRPRSDAQVVRWLFDHVTAIRYDEAAAEIRTDIVGLKARLERAVDSVPARFWAGPCHAKTMTGTCDRDVYTRFNPFAPDARLDAVFTCDGWRGDGRGCGATHKVADRLGYVLDSVEDALVTLDVLRLVARSRGTPWPPAATIRSWRFRGQLAERGVTRGGEELFRGGDVIDLVEQWADKVAGRAKRPA